MSRFYCLVAILCFLFPRVEAQSMDTLFMRAAVKKLYNAKEYTLKVAALMPAENYEFKPSPDEMTFGQHLLHLSQNMGWLSSSYLKGQQNPVPKYEMKLHQKDSVMAVVRR